MNPILVTKTRGQVVENFHRGVICLVNENGDVVFSVGDVNQICFTRSALKLFQVIPLIEQGGQAHFGFTNEELAIMCGSHNAEAKHQVAVRSILSKIGLAESNLKCGAQPPSDRTTRKELESAGLNPSDIHNNCSGKHAGFLALCQLNDWPVDDYLAETHPCQQTIKQTVSEMHEVNPNDLLVGEDGCSAPIFALSVYQQALGYKNLVAPQKFKEPRITACNKVISLMIEHPFMIAGTGRYCTELMQQLAPDVIGKTGADGVYSLAFPNLRLGCTIKIDDGKMGPQYFAAQALLQSMNKFDTDKLSKLRKYISSPIRNWNKHEIGLETASFEGFKNLKLP